LNLINKIQSPHLPHYLFVPATGWDAGRGDDLSPRGAPHCTSIVSPPPRLSIAPTEDALLLSCNWHNKDACSVTATVVLHAPGKPGETAGMESWHTIRLPVEARLHWKQEPLSRNNQTRYSLYSVAPVKRRPRLRRCGVGTRHYRAAHAQQQQLTAAPTAVAADAAAPLQGLLSLSASAAAPTAVAAPGNAGGSATGPPRLISSVANSSHVRPEITRRHATVIPRLTYPAPSEPGSQAPVGIVSSEMGDLSRIRCAVAFLSFFLIFAHRALPSGAAAPPVAAASCSVAVPQWPAVRKHNNIAW
jgi:hypothetical protein